MKIKINNKDVECQNVIMSYSNHLHSGITVEELEVVIHPSNDFIYGLEGELLCIDIDIPNHIYHFDARLFSIHKMIDGWIHIILAVPVEFCRIGNGYYTPENAVIN